MSIAHTPTDILLPQPDDAEPDGFAAGCQEAQDLFDRMREGTASPDDLFRTVILAVHTSDTARGLCDTVQATLNVFGARLVEAEIVKQQLAAALAVIVALQKRFEAVEAKRLALIDQATSVIEDVKAAVPRKVLKVDRAVEFVYGPDGEITGAAIVINDGKPQPSA